jgi:hypothetical protein
MDGILQKMRVIGFATLDLVMRRNILKLKLSNSKYVLVFLLKTPDFNTLHHLKIIFRQVNTLKKSLMILLKIVACKKGIGQVTSLLKLFKI